MKTASQILKSIIFLLLIACIVYCMVTPFYGSEEARDFHSLLRDIYTSIANSAPFSILCAAVYCFRISFVDRKESPIFDTVIFIVFGLLFIISLLPSLCLYGLYRGITSAIKQKSIPEEIEKSNAEYEKICKLIKDKAYAEGYAAGLDDGDFDGFTRGYDAGCTDNSEVFAAHDFVSQYAKRMNMSVPQYLEWARTQQRTQSEEKAEQ